MTESSGLVSSRRDREVREEVEREKMAVEEDLIGRRQVDGEWIGLCIRRRRFGGVSESRADGF
ncbi:unnamed protein product [Thlaspi arvense]|uniref:Uncharacterized protein n=1 Tax=Thlaspi arvense TaxID=13288 RepID=A0AAU9RNA5_THLAR|nr:unnamed protein product [Thlaspi arvense]